MSALTALDTSQHTTPLSLQQIQPNQLTTTAQEIEKNVKEETPNVAAVDKETPKVDLNNYYSNVQAPQAESNGLESHTTQASQNLSNAIATAVTHGLNPQDAMNIQRAKAAYETTMRTAETSTFELKVE